MVRRPIGFNVFEFVVISGLRAEQLARGCSPRVEGPHKIAVTAQMEVAERRVERIPSAAPYFFAGLRVATALALIGAVVAEFVAGTGGTRSGLAYQILQAGLQLKIPRLFAALLLITTAGIVLFLMVSWLSRLALRRWHESELPQER